ncbi:MAG TPA: acyl carrier protein [Arenibaculum sp.]|nr:acyl carrier protein [Arenibaculum sp.]
MSQHTHPAPDPDVIDVLRAWILENNPAVGRIGDDDDLIDTRALDSLQFMRFVYFLEEVFGREIRLEESVLRNLRSLSAICRHFEAGQWAREASHA